MTTPKVSIYTSCTATAPADTRSQDVPADRPSSQHRLSMSTTPSSTTPMRHPASRHHSHSVSLGTYNPDHRVTRRKSITTSAVNANAIRAAIDGHDEAAPRASHRRSLNSRGNLSSRGYDMASELRPHTAGNKTHQSALDVAFGHHDDSAVIDEVAPSQSAGNMSKARSRRASEGSHLSSKRAGGELRCEKCGKGYKHSSCLTKHLSVVPIPPSRVLWCPLHAKGGWEAAI